VSVPGDEPFLSEGSRIDQWFEMALEFMRRGNKIGVWITAGSE
jgi:hypothetical protein